MAHESERAKAIIEQAVAEVENQHSGGPATAIVVELHGFIEEGVARDLLVEAMKGTPLEGVSLRIEQGNSHHDELPETVMFALKEVEV
ncbi:MAG: hypothetical protein GYB68_03475 [Chloroflexi bacterium]|nr:hypothetical protein [Chloroflexota bacterium]